MLKTHPDITPPTIINNNTNKHVPIFITCDIDPIQNEL